MDRVTCIVHSGKVFTADPQKPWAQAVAIRGSRIAAVGSNHEILPLGSESTLSIDLGGRVVLPGLNDAHAHICFMPDKIHRLDLRRQERPDPSLDEALDAVRQAVSHTLPGTVLFGDIGRSVLDDPRATRFTLDEVAPEHPVNLMSFTKNGQLLRRSRSASRAPSSRACWPIWPCSPRTFLPWRRMRSQRRRVS